MDSQKNLYATFTGEHPEGETAPLWHNAAIEKGRLWTLEDYGITYTTWIEGFKQAAEKYPENNCLGTRAGATYNWLNYADSYAKSVNFAKALVSENLLKESEEEGRTLKKIGLYAKN